MGVGTERGNGVKLKKGRRFFYDPIDGWGPTTVDGSEIRRENQLRMAVFPHYLQGFKNIQPVVGLGISEPSTVRRPYVRVCFFLNLMGDKPAFPNQGIVFRSMKTRIKS